MPNSPEHDIHGLAVATVGRLPAHPEPKPLKPWHKVYGVWYVANSELDEKFQLVKARYFSRSPIKRGELRAVHRNPLFKAYCEELLAAPIALARAKLEVDYPFYVEAHKTGLEKILDDGDPKAIPAFTVPILDRVVPKKETAIAATQVIVTLARKQEALLDAEVIEVTAEALPEKDDA